MGTARMFGPRRIEKTLFQRFVGLNWLIILVNVAIASAGFTMLYSVAGGNIDPYASRQMIRFAIGFCLMIAIGVTDLRVWMALAYPAWIIGLLLLVAVEFAGAVGMGGQRWLDIGFMRIQPSELMKIAVVMAMARYFHGRDYYQSRRLSSLVIPILIMVIPMVLVVRQPDLGTGLMIAAGGAAVLFMAGLPAWLFWGAGIAVAGAIPVAWQFLHDYQKNRVLTFIDPESDPLGAGVSDNPVKNCAGIWRDIR